MTAQRQYILPNCNLVIEGLVTGEESDPTSPLTVVLNSECTFPGTADRLSGGREFLNALVKAVSAYAQSLLSGVPYPLAETPTATQPVTLQRTEHHRHQLVATVANADGAETQTAISLNSVQLFDLVEAVDQLLADTFTLPDMTLQVVPLNRRHARPAEPMTKRALPATVGVSALAAASALLFMVPVPEFEPQRREANEQSELEALVEAESANLDNAGAADSGADSDEAPATATADEDTPTADTDTDAATAEDLSSDDTADDAEAATAATDGTVGPVAAGIALGRLATAPAIADADTLDNLGAEVATKLESALEDLADDAPLSFEEVLIYRIAVSEDGEILGYKYENDAALENIDGTPLPQLTFIPVDTESAVDEPVAQLRITFELDGTVKAEPIEAADGE